MSLKIIKVEVNESRKMLTVHTVVWQTRSNEEKEKGVKVIPAHRVIEFSRLNPICQNSKHNLSLDV